MGSLGELLLPSFRPHVKEGAPAGNDEIDEYVETGESHENPAQQVSQTEGHRHVQKDCHDTTTNVYRGFIENFNSVFCLSLQGVNSHHVGQVGDAEDHQEVALEEWPLAQEDEDQHSEEPPSQEVDVVESSGRRVSSVFFIKYTILGHHGLRV